VDLLQGQYKSRVECPDCEKVSITFDPYMFLSVPLPTERYKIVEFTWVGNDPNMTPTVYGVQMLKVADVSMFKKAIAKQFNVPADQLFVCDVWKSKLHRELKNRDMIAEINRRNDDIVVFYSPKPNEPVPVPEPVPSDSNSQNNDTGTEKDKDKEKDKEIDKDKEKDKDKEMDKGKGAGEGNGRSGHSNEGEYDDDDDMDYYSQGGSRAKDTRRVQQQAVLPDFKTFHVLCQTPVDVRTNNYQSSQYREENECIGMPLLITLPLKRPVSHKEVRAKIFELLKSYLTKDKPTPKEKENNNETNCEADATKDTEKIERMPVTFYIF